MIRRAAIAALALGCINLAVGQTTDTLAPLPTPVATTATVVAETSRSTETEWIRQPWGEMGVAHLASAPFPDESRRNGFKSSRGTIPYEGHYDDSSVVFVIPNGFQKGRQVDFIVHFHGHKSDALRVVGKYRLGDQLDISGRNAILVLPQGPKDAADSSGGKLERDGAFKTFMVEVVHVLSTAKRLSAGSEVGDLILSGHGRAHQVLGSVLERGGLTDRVREVWLFDAAYAGLDKLAAPFARPNAKPRLRSIFTGNLVDENVQLMSSVCTAGGEIFVAHHDDLTTRGTSAEHLKSGALKRENARAGVDELPAVLRREPNLFLGTRLGHDDLLFRRRYFEVFARESPSLGETGNKEANRNGEDPGP